MLKKSRLALTALVLVVFAGGWLLGRDKGPDPQAPDAALPPHYEQLGLSEKQMDIIHKVMTAYGGKINALQRQIDDLNKAQVQDMENVLTPDQKAALHKATGKDK